MGKIKRKEVDTHIHSTYSDGRHGVSELVHMIKGTNLKVAVLTDHDRVEGSSEFMSLCEKVGVGSVSGVEISSTDTTTEPQTIDVLGYGFNPDILLQKHNNLLKHNLNVRIEYIKKVLNLYKKKGLMNFNLVSLENYFRLPARAANKYWIIAARAIKIKANIKISETSAFKIAKKELKKGGEYFVEKDRYVSTKEAISAIKESGGIAVWAHPTKTLEKLKKYHKNEDARTIFSKILVRMIDEGLEGIEVYTPHNTESRENFLLNYAESYRLVVTGGSDLHGHHGLSEDCLGQTGISYREFLKIKEEIFANNQ